MAGRPRKPTALKKLQGTARKDRLKKGEPKPTGKPGGAPRYLMKEARDLWRVIVPELEVMGVAAKVDRAMLEGLCTAYAKARSADRNLRKGMFTADGRVRDAVRVSRDCWDAFRKFCNEYGLTAQSRGKLDVSAPSGGPSEEEGVTSIKDFLRGRRSG